MTTSLQTVELLAPISALCASPSCKRRYRQQETTKTLWSYGAKRSKMSSSQGLNEKAPPFLPGSVSRDVLLVFRAPSPCPPSFLRARDEAFILDKLTVMQNQCEDLMNRAADLLREATSNLPEDEIEWMSKVALQLNVDDGLNGNERTIEDLSPTTLFCLCLKVAALENPLGIGASRMWPILSQWDTWGYMGVRHYKEWEPYAAVCHRCFHAEPLGHFCLCRSREDLLNVLHFDTKTLPGCWNYLPADALIPFGPRKDKFAHTPEKVGPSLCTFLRTVLRAKSQ